MGDYGQYIVPTADTLINFKVGQPATTLLPLDLLRECAASKFAETDPMFLQYGHIKGYPKFRAALAEFLTAGYNHPVDPEKLFVTNGVTGGLSLICSLFLQAGDLVFLEEPSYFLALSIMADFKMNVRQIPMEVDGINVDALEALLVRGIIPKVLYTIPTCHNPTGRTMSRAKREKLVELSIKYDFMIVADEVYQLLSFPSVNPPPPMFTFDKKGTVLALGSFSKILAPALRLGWIQGSPKLLSKITSSGQLDSSGGISPVISGIVHAALTLGHQAKHLKDTKQTLWNRASALMSALEKHLPDGTSFEVPDGGYFILVKLPSHMIAADLLPVATERHKVAFLPGSSFGASMKNFLRLSFSWYGMEDLATGAERLGAAIRDYAGTLTTNSSSSTAVNTSETDELKVAVHGASGRLGSLIVSELRKEGNGCCFAGAIDTRSGELVKTADVIIDVTLPAGTRKLLSLLQQSSSCHNIPLVIGTTGSDLPMDEIQKYASNNAAVVLTSNFSVGVSLVTDLARRAVQSIPANWNVSMMEMHHTAKLDAPSGTAKTLKQAVVRTGAPAVDGEKEVEVVSMRLGDEVGQHTVCFAGPGERIEIKHQATRREVFAIGALRNAEWVKSQPKGLYIQ